MVPIRMTEATLMINSLDYLIRYYTLAGSDLLPALQLTGFQRQFEFHSKSFAAAI